MFFASVIFISPVLAAGALEGLKNTADKGYGAIPFETSSPADIVGQIIGVVLSLIGVIIFAYLVYGGFLWMTAGGNSKKVEDAQGIIKNTIVGLIVVVSAYAIVSFVLKQLLAV